MLFSKIKVEINLQISSQLKEVVWRLRYFLYLRKGCVGLKLFS
jgi:hypothetical protein